LEKLKIYKEGKYMDITVDGKAMDIVLESERTVGELLAALEEWLAGGGYRVSALTIDGKAVGVDALEEAFVVELDAISRLDIRTESEDALALAALTGAVETLDTWEGASFEERSAVSAAWGRSAAASLLAGADRPLFDGITGALQGGSLTPEAAKAVVLERIREMEEPLAELQAISALIGETATRLENLGLDVQTGKDGHAAETVQLFSSVMGKLFRLLRLLQTRNLAIPNVEQQSLRDFVEEFNTVLREFLAAYEGRDSVLSGDLAEYEAAPRLRSLYTALIAIREAA
jgi:hypothetical protein